MGNSIIPGAGPREFDTKCKITEVGNKDSKKVVLALGSLIHRGKSAWGNMPEIVSKDFDAKFVSFDWPKKEYNNEQVLSQIEEYIKNSGAEEIVLAGLSFGNVVTKQLIEKLSPEIKAKIKGNISISGVADFNNLAGMEAVGKLKKVVSNKVFGILVAKPLLGLAGKTDRGTIGTKKLENFASKNMVDPNTGISKAILNKHIKAASLGLTPGLVDRFGKMLENDYSFPSTENIDNEIKTFSIYSSNDPTFNNPKENAQKVLQGKNNGKLIEIKDGGHAALVEQPKKYDKEIKKILFEIFKK
ncbi:MAG: hypothetical protein PHR68_03525 [Candidatus Gracilibacteria bacterium]|nr:hypothetical protein [Candidatus Gracilibacteria bacterium]